MLLDPSQFRLVSHHPEVVAFQIIPEDVAGLRQLHPVRHRLSR